MTHRYELSAMAQFVDDVDTRIEQMTDRCSRLATTAATIRDAYSGPAADGFQATLEAWQRDMDGHLKLLRDLRDRVQVAHDNYAEAERVNGTMLNFG